MRAKRGGWGSAQRCLRRRQFSPRHRARVMISSCGGRSSAVEHRTVAPRVVGSNPIAHPKKSSKISVFAAVATPVAGCFPTLAPIARVCFGVRNSGVSLLPPQKSGQLGWLASSRHPPPILIETGKRRTGRAATQGENSVAIGGALIRFYDASFQHARAIAQFSCAWTTNTLTAPSESETSLSPCCAFLAGSSRMPENSNSAHAADRTSAEFSPIPPVNANTSRPPKLATIEPIPVRRRCTKISNASLALAFPFSIAATISRMSPDIPEIPRRPDSLLSKLSSSSAVSESRRIK